MLGSRIPAKLMSLTIVKISHRKTQIRIKNSLKKIETNVRLKQGAGLAPQLCNLTLWQVIRKLPVETKGTLFYTSFQIDEYADHIYLMTHIRFGLT